MYLIVQVILFLIIEFILNFWKYFQYINIVCVIISMIDIV